MNTRVFFINNVGRSVAGLFLFASLLFCASCDHDELSSTNAGEESGELIPVKVSVGGINGFSNGEQSVTRANAQPQSIAIPFNDDYRLQVNIQASKSAPQTRAAVTPLKEGVRFRVLAYLQGIGTDKFKASADYEIQAGGILNQLSGDLNLPSGTYQFVCYSYNTSAPLPAFDGSTQLEVNDIGVGTDFLRTIVTQKVEGGGSGGTLNINFDHFCSSLNVKVDASRMGGDITDCSATLSGLKRSTASWNVSTTTLNVQPGDIPNDLSFAWDSPSESVIESDAQIVMPASNVDLTLRFPSITIGENTYTDKSVSLPKVKFEQGTSYTCTVNFVPAVVDLNSDGSTANCYIVLESNTQYSFDATIRGNGSNVPGINYSTLPDLATATEARVIWQTGGPTAVVESVSLENGKVVFTTGKAAEGNAVIGIFPTNSPAAECLWSWHIWRLQAVPGVVVTTKNPSPNTASPNVTVMDLNLGAYSNLESNDNVGALGLYYQWGRKDPFPGSASFNGGEPNNIYGSYNNNGVTGAWNGAYRIQTMPRSTGGTEAWAVKYPTTFITSIAGIPDWMITKNDNLWGTPWVAAGSIGGYNGNQGTKSIYDPCPIGYRVPPQDTWNLQKGSPRTSGNILAAGWFPAAGNRMHNTGALVNPFVGYYWSSSPYGNQSGLLHFNTSGGFKPQAYNYRSHAFSVRCVAE
ncbi:hypothetical protein DW228_05995 [Bacteroides fragilis]|uniref:Fibrobacter succinogenes major paralogous domain-containing protein n=1 Tax=Bacteroides fragilis TaxID=817 RepID=A0A396C198_BACFG|nr:fimbrillin family protein [Bacteroides fragilis]RHH14348.1 hypothetical protein DW228_05995 [Bacteroides fragilis]